ESVHTKARTCFITGVSIEPMPDIVISPAPFVAEVVRVKRRTAGSVVSTSGLTPDVGTPEIQLTNFAAHVHAEIVIPRSAIRFIFEDVARALPEGAYPAGGNCRIKGSS